MKHGKIEGDSSMLVLKTEGFKWQGIWATSKSSEHPLTDNQKEKGNPVLMARS